MESVLVEKSVNGGVLFRSFSSSFSLDGSFHYINKNLPCNQPPLLPLPSVNPSWKERGMSIHHHRQKNPRHASTSPRKREQRDRFFLLPVSAPVPVSIPIPTSVLPFPVPDKRSAKNLQDAAKEEVIWTGTVYSVSPPPSSIPMPSFVMVRGKGNTGKVITEKACGEGRTIDASATNELRKLLKL